MALIPKGQCSPQSAHWRQSRDGLATERPSWRRSGRNERSWPQTPRDSPAPQLPLAKAGATQLGAPCNRDPRLWPCAPHWVSPINRSERMSSSATRCRRCARPVRRSPRHGLPLLPALQQGFEIRERLVGGRRYRIAGKGTSYGVQVTAVLVVVTVQAQQLPVAAV